MHLGDLILITPFLQVLRRHAQGSDITLVVDEKVADVVRYNPDIDHLITIDKKGKDNSISACLLYTSPSPRDKRQSRMPSSA